MNTDIEASADESYSMPCAEALLAGHPLLSPDFRAMLWNLRTRWQLQLERDGTPGRDDKLWHASPAAMQ